MDMEMLTNRQMIERDTDMEILKVVIKHLSEEINDATICNDGYRMSTEICDTISKIEIMLRAAKLMRELNVRNCSLTELACIRARAMGECPCEEENSDGVEA
jgi:hypothetical protein